MNEKPWVKKGSVSNTFGSSEFVAMMLLFDMGVIPNKFSYNLFHATSFVTLDPF